VAGVGGLILYGAAVLAVGPHSMAQDWRTASRESAGIAPDPTVERRAVVQVYAARAWGWRGHFGVHCWIAVKPSDSPRFTVYEVSGWRARAMGNAVTVSQRPADGRWFGQAPELLGDLRGDGVDEVIARIEAAVASYPHAGVYRIWPGPNSNTFVAHIVRAVPELRVDLPPTAIGKDYLANGSLFGRAPSGTGFQVSLLGLFGVLAAVEEGVELNVLGLTFGVDPMDLAIKLPMIGRIGPARAHGEGSS